MTLVPLGRAGAIGVVKDVPTHTAPLEAWTKALNVRFKDGIIERMDGYQEVFNITVSALTASQQIAVSPWFACPVPTVTDYFWLYGSGNYVYAANSNSNGSHVTRWSTATASHIAYSATPSIRWNQANVGGIPYLTNSKDPLQVWEPPSIYTKLKAARWDSSANSTWAAFTRSSTVISAKCFNIRAYREFLVALDTTENDVRYPRRVRWSHPVIPGNEPVTWDDTRTDKLARYVDLDGTRGFVLDALVLGDINLIYKEDSVWGMQFTGNTRYVHQFRPLINDIGLYSRGCVASLGSKHIFLTNTEDVVITDGLSYQSVIDGRNRTSLFSSINPTYSSNTFIAVDYANAEVLVFIPSVGNSDTFWCDHAFVWNWRSNTWTERDIRASNAATGVIKFGYGTAKLLRSWDFMIGNTWADMAGTSWGTRAYSPINEGLLVCYPSDTSPKLLQYNVTSTYAGQDFDAYVEREGFVITGLDRNGQPIYDPTIVKRLNRVWVHASGSPGAIIRVYVGARMELTQPMGYTNAVDYVVGSSHSIPCRVTGRDLGIRCEIIGNAQITGFDFDIDIVGRF